MPKYNESRSWRFAPMLVLVLGLVLATAAPAVPLKLHVPSPDWRDQIVYFVLTDRFADGDPRNNDQGAGEFKAGERSRYNGGDLAGLRQRLPYIRGLGATALWITPPVANQWLDPSGSHAGYHGYWAENFMRIDRHLGSLADYQRLSDALHRAGMYLVQDIVVNHTGNYYTYRDRWSPADPAQGWEAHDATPPVPRPSQPPFDRNDPRDLAQRQAGIYHWTPDVVDYNDPRQEHDFQMSGLDDLNTENPAVRRELRRSYGWWIRAAGVDAYRIDTAYYVPPEYFDDFLNAGDAQAPGIARVARQTGRRNFLAFGEGFGIDRPGTDTQSRKIEGYMTGADGRPLLPGMLNFPLYGALGDAFARGRPPAELGDRITRMMQIHARPHGMPTFVDNHDVDRFLAGGSQAGLRQALLAMMTLPGIPVIYYGTEQAYTEPRAAMFASGYGSGGRDRYDTSAPLYRDIAAMSALRRGHRLFSRGVPTVLAANAAQSGGLAYRMTWRDQSALVVFNNADSETLLAGVDTGLAAGTPLHGLYGLHGRPQPLVVGSDGRLSLRLPPRSGMVWQAGQGRRRAGVPSAASAPVSTQASASTSRSMPASASAPAITLDPGPSASAAGDFAIGGTVRGIDRLQLVVDGDMANARELRVDGQGRWQGVIDTAAMVDPQVAHTVTAWSEARGVSASREFRVQRDWQLRADVADPEGDDHGPTGRLRPPGDSTFEAPGLLDLRRVRAFAAGGALRIELTMQRLARNWNPPNGFDHVAFTVFIELPGRDGGARVMPLQNASLPGDMRWHLRLRAGGWTNALFGAEGASASHEGTPLTPGASLAVDAAANTVTFTLPAAVLGRLPSLAGARIYVTTWDYDGGYRPLAPDPQPFAFSGGAADDAKVMDDSGVIVLP